MGVVVNGAPVLQPIEPGANQAPSLSGPQASVSLAGKQASYHLLHRGPVRIHEIICINSIVSGRQSALDQTFSAHQRLPCT